MPRFPTFISLFHAFSMFVKSCRGVAKIEVSSPVPPCPCLGHKSEACLNAYVCMGVGRIHTCTKCDNREKRLASTI